MRLFTCPHCGATAYFDNIRCICGGEMTFDSDLAAMTDATAPCANRAVIECNWSARAGGLCRACAMTEVAPGDADPATAVQWRDAECDKRWVLHALGRWGWFTEEDEGPAPVFHLLSERIAPKGTVTMGHEDGLVTINVTEADPVEEVRRRQNLGEPYRTMIGHFRHELAHFLFQRLQEAPGFSDAFAQRFGDVDQDYAAALERHYNDGAPEDWRLRHVTAYASAHPHEDWAETVAHLMHLTEIVDSAVAVGLGSGTASEDGEDVYRSDNAQQLITDGAALGLALNHVNRSMGLSDIYPFVLSDAVRDKLVFAHRWLRRGA